MEGRCEPITDYTENSGFIEVIPDLGDAFPDAARNEFPHERCKAEIPVGGFVDTGKEKMCSHLFHGDDRPVHIMRLDYAL